MVTLWGILISLFTLGWGHLIWGVVCGARGNEWAWKGRNWQSVEHFRHTQRNWALAGLAFLVAYVAVLVLVVVAISGLFFSAASGATHGALPSQPGITSQSFSPGSSPS